MSSKPNRNIVAEVTLCDLMSVYESGSLSMRQMLGECVKKDYHKFYLTRMKIITTLIHHDKCSDDIDALMVRPNPLMKGFDLALDFKGRSIVMHIRSQKKWKDIKIGIEKAKENLTAQLEGKLGRCCVCFEPLKDAETTYSCSTCDETLCMCCIDGLRKNETKFKCVICRSINNCSHLLD